MKKNIINVSLFVVVAATLTLAGCAKSDYSEGGSQTPASTAPKAAGAAGDAKTPVAQEAKPVAAQPQAAP